MATIELSDAAPKVDGALGFTLGNSDFELKAGDTYETDDALLIGSAVVNPFLKVVFPEPVAQDEQPDYDPNDPHQNPAADHLTPQGSPEVKEAADEADAAIQRAAFPNNPAADDADIADAAVQQAKITADAAPSTTPQTTPTVTAATPPADTSKPATSTTGASS